MGWPAVAISGANRGQTAFFYLRAKSKKGSGLIYFDDAKREETSVTNSERIFPDEPLKFIQRCVNQQNVKWTYHVNMRMKDRFIPRQFIIDSTSSYEIIEEYPTDKYFPSYLVRSEYQKQIFHVLFATDVKDDNVRIVTAYWPNPDQWEKDLRQRR